MNNIRVSISYIHEFSLFYASAGANSVFIGTTRDMFEGKQVTHLSYEAYPDMAIESMKDIVKTVYLIT